MAQKVKIDGLADAVMKELTEYADLATVDMKAAVKKAGNTVKKQIQGSAPKDTGAYSKSWSVKNTKETSKSLEVTVYSRNRYQLAHVSICKIKRSIVGTELYFISIVLGDFLLI